MLEALIIAASLSTNPLDQCYLQGEIVKFDVYEFNTTDADVPKRVQEVLWLDSRYYNIYMRQCILSTKMKM